MFGDDTGAARRTVGVQRDGRLWRRHPADLAALVLEDRVAPSWLDLRATCKTAGAVPPGAVSGRPNGAQRDPRLGACRRHTRCSHRRAFWPIAASRAIRRRARACHPADGRAGGVCAEPGIGKGPGSNRWRSLTARGKPQIPGVEATARTHGVSREATDTFARESPRRGADGGVMYDMGGGVRVDVSLPGAARPRSRTAIYPVADARASLMRDGVSGGRGRA